MVLPLAYNVRIREGTEPFIRAWYVLYMDGIYCKEYCVLFYWLCMGLMLTVQDKNRQGPIRGKRGETVFDHRGTMRSCGGEPDFRWSK